MENLLRVRIRERARQLDADPQRLIERQPAFLQPRGEGAALDVLHRQELATLIDTDFEQRADVGMVEAGDGARFAEEPPRRRAIVLRRVAEQLDRGLTVEACVPGQIHHAHPSRAQDRHELVMRDPGPGQRNWAVHDTGRA